MTTDFQYDVFISYARADGADHAQTLRDTFRELDKRTYLDTSMIESGQKWEQNLHDSLLSAKAMIFVLTAGSVDLDSYCKIEWEMAVDHNIPILPVRVDSTTDFTIHKPYSTIQYIDLTNDWNAGIDEISHFLTRYDYLYELRDELNNLVASSTARRFIEIIATENAAAKQQLKRRVKVRIPKRQQTEAIEFSSFHDAWQHYNGQVLLLGAAGAGKTTTLLHYAQRLVTNYLADRNQPVPVFASIAYWDSYADQPLHKWLPQENDLPDAMQDVIDNGRAVLILDGLDELGSSKPLDPEKPEKGTFDPRLRFLKHVQTAIDFGNQILITSRVTDYEDIGEKLNIKGAIELQPLTDNQIKTYLADVPTVQSTVMGDDGLLDICRSPLLLSLIAFGYRDAPDDLKALPSMQEGDLRDAIFEQYITQSYDLEAQRRELTGEEMPFSLEKMMDVLGYAAMINVCGGRRNDDFYQKEYTDEELLLHLHDGTLIEENRLIRHDLIHKLREDEIDDFLQWFNVKESGFGFHHLMIRDYLAYTFSTKYLKNIDKFPRKFSPIIALGKLRDYRAVEDLIHFLLYSEKPYIRAESAQALGEIGDNRATLPLINALNDYEKYPKHGVMHYSVASTVAEALGKLGDKSAVQPLIESLQIFECESLRQSSAIALGKIGDHRAIDPLIQMLNDEDENMQISSVIGLGKMGDQHSINSLIKLMKNTNSSTIHTFVLLSLQTAGTPEALQAVAEWRAS